MSQRYGIKVISQGRLMELSPILQHVLIIHRSQSKEYYLMKTPYLTSYVHVGIIYRQEPCYFIG